MRSQAWARTHPIGTKKPPNQRLCLTLFLKEHVQVTVRRYHKLKLDIFDFCWSLR